MKKNAYAGSRMRHLVHSTLYDLPTIPQAHTAKKSHGFTNATESFTNPIKPLTGLNYSLFLSRRRRKYEYFAKLERMQVINHATVNPLLGIRAYNSLLNGSIILVANSFMVLLSNAGIVNAFIKNPASLELVGHEQKQQCGEENEEITALVYRTVIYAIISNGYPVIEIHSVVIL
ncbi:hypothetical protein CBL_05323 [Carabus blaptoides fortunei]